MGNAICTISIVTYNSQHIFKVLDNIKKLFAMDTRFRITIFDNNSEKGYQKKLSSYEDMADITYHYSNQGFGFGHNYNLLRSSEKYFVVFNPDIILEKETLLRMIEQMEENPSISLLVPKILNPDGTTQYLVRDRVSVFDYALRFIPFTFVKNLFHNRLFSYECRDLPDDRNTQIRIGSGCFMLIRGADYKLINGFDERYFMYFEDYDFCLELNNRQKKIFYTPFSSVIHYYERGAHKNSRLFKIFLQSMYKFFNKWGWKWY